MKVQDRTNRKVQDCTIRKVQDCTIRKVQDCMSDSVEVLSDSATLQEAANKMRALSCGFMPVANALSGGITGVITDRDIVVRGTASGLPVSAVVANIVSDQLHYCYRDEPLEAAVNRMRDHQLYRLVVLNNPEQKECCGVLTLGDVLRHGEVHLAETVAKDILKQAA